MLIYFIKLRLTVESIENKLPKIAKIAQSLSPKIDEANRLLRKIFPQYTHQEIYTLNIRNKTLIIGTNKNHISCELYYKIPQILNERPQSLLYVDKVIVKHITSQKKQDYTLPKAVKPSIHTVTKMYKFASCISNNNLRSALKKLAQSIAPTT